MARGIRRNKGRFVADTSGNVDVADGTIVVDDAGTKPVAVADDIERVSPAAVTGSDGAVIDSGDDNGANGDSDQSEQPRRKRGRPAGSGAKNKAGAYPLNVRGLEKLLVGIHGGIAMMASSPGFALDTAQKVFDGKTEAEFLAQSVADVARHYNPTVFEQKTIDWSNLVQCMAMVYGPRLYNMRADRRAAKPAKAPTAPAFTFAPRPIDPQPAANRAAAASSPLPNNDFSPPSENELRTGVIPGVGEIVVPNDFFKMN